MDSRQLAQIHPNAFTHPHDQSALTALSQIPLVPQILRKAAHLHVEERFRAHHMRNSIHLGPRQLPSLWRLVNQVAEKFSARPPDTYVTAVGGANAFAFGLENRSLVLTSKLVDIMPERELEAIIAHELSHMLCQHMLYRNVGLFLTLHSMGLLVQLAPTKLVSHSVKMAYAAWSRAAEYSADRAAILILRDPEAMVGCLSRLAGVPESLQNEFDPRLFAEQATEYEESATLWSRLVTLDMGLLDSHPEPSQRAAAVLEWAESDQYRAILDGRYPTLWEVETEDRILIEGFHHCPLCKDPIGALETCPRCGLDQRPECQRVCRNGHPASIHWRFCKACGVELAED